MKKNATPQRVRLFKNLYGLLILLFISLSGFSQNVGINATGALPNASAGLDVDFMNMGLLIPRIALTGRANAAPLTAKVAGMIVYNTAAIADVTPGFYYNDGTNWIAGFPTGSSIGDMLYWNGSAWVKIPVGTSGQFLQLSASNVPTWGGAAFSSITTTAASAITGITATSGGTITSDGGLAILARGVCWKTATGPTIADLKTSDGAGTGTFVSNLTGLSPVTTYYVKAYSSNSGVTTYGNEIIFTTTAVLPTLAATNPATGITGSTAISGGNVTSNGGSPILERGICYGSAANPTTANSKVIDLPNPPTAPGTGTFACNITGLTGYTIYHIRSYAINSIGTSYGTDISFTTSVIPPTLVTTAATNIQSTSVISGASMNWNGGGYQNYQNYGVAYSTVSNSATPTLVATNTTNGSVNPLVNITPWTTNITGLTPNTTYYIRSYISLYSSVSYTWVTVYGNELIFTTALLQTSPVTSVTTSTAVCGGTIGAGAIINARGVCWNTSTKPTLANSFTNDGTGTGTFISNLTGLTNGVTYFIRAYCTDNLNNTTYGNEYSFTTGTPKAIGDALAGGKVIYVDPTGQHGLIGALVDQGNSVAWGCYGTTVGIGTVQGGNVIYAGLNNTNLIVASCGAGTAAQLCAAYTAGGTNLPGITNWYLPSHDELQILCDQRAIINLTTTPSYAGSGCLYWSSTEYSSAIAYCHYSLGGIYDYNIYKNSTYYSSTSNLTYVRAVRAF